MTNLLCTFLKKNSPFGLRCHNIHDPRVASETPSWLPHSDIPVSNLSTDLVVDKSYHTHLAAFGQQNPLVHNLLWDHRPSQNKSRTQLEHSKENNDDLFDVEWSDTYSIVCNMANLYTWKKSPKGEVSRTTKINELERLCMSLRMSYESKSIHMDYVYKPKHLVYGELCMVVRTEIIRHAFVLLHFHLTSFCCSA